MKKLYCIHCKAAELMEVKEKNHNVPDLDNTKDQVFVIQKEPYPICVIFAEKQRQDSKGSKVLPGVVIRTAKMTKFRCKTCKGRDSCIHLCIYRQAQDEILLSESLQSMRISDKNKNTSNTNVDTDLLEKEIDLNKKPNTKQKSKKNNILNPENFHGKEVNVFKQYFHYPPTKLDKELNNKINIVESLFPDKQMLPEGLNVKSCEKCGNLYTKVTLESRHPIIHHGRPTKDSRNSTLNLYYIENTKCHCNSVLDTWIYAYIYLCI